MRVLMGVLLAMAAGCTDAVEPAPRDAPLATCAESGCRWAASGTETGWAPCFESVCWCDDISSHHPPYPRFQCSRTPCADGPQLCPMGQHDEYAPYDGGHASVCFCMPDGT